MGFSKTTFLCPHCRQESQYVPPKAPKPREYTAGIPKADFKRLLSNVLNSEKLSILLRNRQLYLLLSRIYGSQVRKLWKAEQFKVKDESDLADGTKDNLQKWLKPIVKRVSERED